jgi:hypothetical protein
MRSKNSCGCHQSEVVTMVTNLAKWGQFGVCHQSPEVSESSRRSSHIDHRLRGFLSPIVTMFVTIVFWGGKVLPAPPRDQVVTV